MKPKDEVVIKRGAWTWRVRPFLADRVELLEAVILSGRLDREGERVKETGGRRTIWRMKFNDGRVGEVFIKHYSRPRRVKQLKHLIRFSRTRQEWEMGLQLEALGLPVARHLAMAERRIAGLLQEDYLLEEVLSGWQNFDYWFREKWEPVRAGPNVHRRREVIARLADLIRTLHDLGVLQRDFKPDSIMVGPDSSFRLVDLERVLIKKRQGGLNLADRLANLAKIDQTFGFIGTASDRLRFLRRYFHDRQFSPSEFRVLVAEISRRAELEWRKKAWAVRVWVNTENESYHQYRFGGLEVSAYLTLHPPFLQELARQIQAGTAASAEHLCAWGPRGPHFRLSARWCDARTALEHTASLYYRKPPFVPGRAAFYPAGGRWGLLLTLIPEPRLPGWEEAAAAARAQQQEVEFAAELGRVLCIFHRMGIVLTAYDHDSFLYDAAYPDPLLRFYLYRLDRLELNRSLSAADAEAHLQAVARRLSLSPPASEALACHYHRCRLRWFKSRERW